MFQHNVPMPLDTELKEILSFHLKKEKATPEYWSKEFADFDYVMDCIVGGTKAYTAMLEWAFASESPFVFVHDAPNGQLKKFKFQVGGELGINYSIEPKTLKDGRQAMSYDIDRGGVKFKATQTPEGHLVGPFYFKDKDVEIKACFKEVQNGKEPTSVLDGEINIVRPIGGISVFYKGNYEHGVPKSIRQSMKVSYPNCKSLHENYEKYHDGLRTYGYERSKFQDERDDVVETYYKNGVFSHQKTMEKLTYDIKQAGKVLAWAALAAVVCVGGIKTVGAQKAPLPIQNQQQRG